MKHINTEITHATHTETFELSHKEVQDSYGSVCQWIDDFGQKKFSNWANMKLNTNTHMKDMGDCIHLVIIFDLPDRYAHAMKII